MNHLLFFRLGNKLIQASFRGRYPKHFARFLLAVSSHFAAQADGVNAVVTADQQSPVGRYREERRQDRLAFSGESGERLFQIGLDDLIDLIFFLLVG